MKRILSFLTILFSVCMSMSGQTENVKVLKPVKATLEDYIFLLNMNGYEAFSFDISSLLDGQYKISFVVKEYEDGNLIQDNLWPEEKLYLTRTNMTLLSDFPEESRKEIKPEEMADPDRGIYTMSKKITIGFAPGANDSVKKIMVDLENMSSRNGGLILHPQYVNNDSVNGKKLYMYYAKPFKTGEFTTGQFIPLVLLGSAWYDKNIGSHRFCGEDKIDPDMSTKILQHIPHYYVIGVEINLLNKSS